VKLASCDLKKGDPVTGLTIIRSENTNLLFYFCLLNYSLLTPSLLKECFKINVIVLSAATMSSKYCSKCARKLPISSFLKDALASPSSRVYSTCIQCRSRKIASNSKKRAALQSLDPNIQPAKHVRRSNGPQPTVTCPQAPLPPNLPVELPLPNSPTEPGPPLAPITA
jgi:hypothetical protein